MKATGINAPRDARPNLFFPIWINEETLEFSLIEPLVNGWKSIIPLTDGQEMRWYWSKNKFEESRDEVIIKKVGNSYSLYKKQRPTLGDIPSKPGKTTFYKPAYSNSHSSAEIKSLFDQKKIFSYSKSSKLIKDFIYLANTKQNDIVLDFFAGSGTTAHAVMELNKEDGLSRKFILVQLDEKIKDKQALKFCKDNYLQGVISSITIERVNRAGRKLLDEIEGNKQQDMLEATKTDLDIGYKVFSLKQKPELEIFINVYNKDIDILYNMMLKVGVELHKKIEKISSSMYKVEHNYYVVENITSEDKALLENIKDSYIY